MTQKKIEIVDAKVLNKGPLFAKMKIYVPKWDMEIREVLCFKKNGNVWFNLPSKEFQDEDGQKKYMAYVRFGKPETHHAFQSILKEEFKEWLAVNGEVVPLENEDTPF